MRTPSTGVARAAWLVWLAALTAGPACHERGSTTPPREGAGEAEPPPAVLEEGFVVLPWGSRVYLEPRFGGASARLGWPSLPPPPWPPAGYVARVVGRRDGFVEIAPILPPSASERFCGPPLEGEAFDVRLFVSPWVLAPVLTRDLEVSRDDGTALSLRPGALVRPIAGDPEGRHAIAAGGIRVRAAVPDDAVGLAYAAPNPMPMPDQRSWQLPEGRPYGFDGWPLELELGFGHDVAIASVTRQDEGHVVELTTPCARVLVRSETEPVSWGVQPFEPHGIEFGLGTPDRVPAVVLEAAGLEPPELEPEPAFGVAFREDGMVEVPGAEAEPPPELPAELVPPDPSESILEGGVLSGTVLSGTFDGPSLLGVPGVPARPELAFEEGTPVYLSPAGPPAGTLAELRVFIEDGWIAGDRLCFTTAFGSRFDPTLPVCLPADEARVRNPATDVLDFASVTLRAGSLRVTGALDEPQVARALRRQRPDLRRCAGEAMQQVGQWPVGDFELALDVDGKGRVTQVRSLSPPIVSFTPCAVAAAERWVVPAPTDAAPAQVTLSGHLVLR